ADEKKSSLNHLKTIIKGQSGVNGGSQCMDGKNGEHTIIPVPVGTVLRNDRREVLAELDVKGSAFLAARGGEGGKGNAFFRSSTKQTPTCAEIGAEGEGFPFEIELKTSAHVGLIGFPNAGKSTLLRSVTRAAPKVAAYPFTTLNPHVGVVDFDDYERISIADIPGIIQDSHKNKGLGIAFLRHIERCLCFLYVIDVSQSNPEEALQVLQNELEEYCPGLSSRPHKIIANKMDAEGSEDNFVRLVRHCGKDRVLGISAKHGVNLKAMLDEVRVMYDNHMASRKDGDNRFSQQ
ncbi:GTPbinding protein 5like, partial [Caligus rogercresseyi]